MDRRQNRAWVRISVLVVLSVVASVADAAWAMDMPTFPVGVFYTSKRTDAAYVARVAKDLKAKQFNTVVLNEAVTREMLDALAGQGLAVITCGDKFLDHPAVIAAVVGQGQEPGYKADATALSAACQALGKKTEKPVFACWPGEGMGLFGARDPRSMWKTLTPKVRCFRWYGIGKSHYGVLHKHSDKGWLAFTSVLSIAQRGETPFWVVLPGFGQADPEAEHTNPLPTDIKAMTHLALAYRARGVFFYGLQSREPWQGLVEEETLKSVAGKFEAASEMAALIHKHAALLASFQHIGLDLRCPNPVVDAVPVKAGPDGQMHIYVVNEDTRKPATARLLLWDERWTWTKATDVFSGKSLEVKPKDEEGYLGASITLPPGGAQLLRVDAAGKKAKKK